MIYVTDGYIFAVTTFVRKHTEVSRKIQLQICKSCMRKEILFSNINNTEYTHLTNDLKFKPKKIVKETIFEK